ncbi:MAG: hypothetical protein ACTHMM_18300 [Agriterribacter sp.]
MLEQEVIKVETIDLSVVEAQDRALIDKQIATAKQYPRNIHRVRDNIVAISSMDEDTAKSCGYALPRGGKTINGPSVHLARIVAQQYGNIRIDSKITDIDRTHVTGQATCIDLENNVGIRVEVKRKITGSNGARYNEDMITMTGNAASAIALRNAIYSTIPKPLIDAGYKAAQEKIIGDVSDETKLIAKRKKTLDEFMKSYGVDEKAILKALGLREVTQIKAEEIKTLVGLWQAIKDGDTTVNETFYPEKEKDTTAAIEDVQLLFDQKKHLLSPEDLKNAERILSAKESTSYAKLLKLLQSK